MGVTEGKLVGISTVDAVVGISVGTLGGAVGIVIGSIVGPPINKK